MRASVLGYLYKIAVLGKRCKQLCYIDGITRSQVLKYNRDGMDIVGICPTNGGPKIRLTRNV